METGYRSSMDDNYSYRGGSRRSVSAASSPRVAPLEVASDGPPQQFKLLVDSEGKAKQIKLYSAAPPHMLAFWINSIAFATAFLSTFAAAPLISSAPAQILNRDVPGQCLHSSSKAQGTELFR